MAVIEDTYNLVVVQIECHLAFTINECDYLREPTASITVLDSLHKVSRFASEIAELGSSFRGQYLAWALTRLRGIFTWAARLPKDQRPQVMVFPEMSVPSEHLSEVRDFANIHNCIVIAGNNTVNHTNLKYLQSVGIEVGSPPEKLINAANSVLAIFGPDAGDPPQHVAHGRYKLKLSPMEMPGEHDESSKENAKENFVVRNYHFSKPTQLCIQPFVCAEAYQGAQTHTPAQLVTISAYDSNPERYDDFIRQTNRLTKVVAMASGGRYGKSTIRLNSDTRMPNWWDGRLPEGDAIVLQRVPKDNRVAGPGSAEIDKLHSLRRLVSILPRNRSDESFRLHKNVATILQDAFPGEFAVPEIEGKIIEALKRHTPNALQKLTYEHMATVAGLGQLTRAGASVFTDECVYG